MYVGHWNLTTDILHNLRAPKEYRFLFIFYRKILPLKICLFLTESSHDIVESSRYITRDRSHMHTREIVWIQAPLWLQKWMTTLKSVPLMYRFWALGRPIIYVRGDHVIAAKCHYDENPGIFKRGMIYLPQL